MKDFMKEMMATATVLVYITIVWLMMLGYLTFMMWVVDLFFD